MKKIIVILSCIITCIHVYAMEKDDPIIENQNQAGFVYWSVLPEELKAGTLKLAIFDLVKNRKSANKLKKEIVNLKVIDHNIKDALNKIFSNKYILELAEKINYSTIDPISPLHLAQALLCKDFFISFKNYLTEVNDQDPDELGKNLLLLMLNKSLDQLKEDIRKGANLNIEDNNGVVALRAAIFMQNINRIKVLINGGTNLNLHDKKYGHSALITATNWKNLEIVEVLIDAGVDINIQDKNGYTALIKAVMLKNLDIVKVLITAGANLSIQDNNGYTALIHAVKRRHLDIVKVLINAGVQLDIKDIDGNETYYSRKYNKKLNALLDQSTSKQSCVIN